MAAGKRLGMVKNAARGAVVVDYTASLEELGGEW